MKKGQSEATAGIVYIHDLLVSKQRGWCVVSTSSTGSMEPLLASAVDSKVKKPNCGQMVAHLSTVARTVYVSYGGRVH